MCGIAGIISSNNKADFCESIVRAILEKTEYRGPDQRGTFFYKNSDYNFCLGANRLSIIDIGPSGNQPMYLDDLVIVYNGEVYNYLEIKEELVKKGHIFSGNSDTEVILHAFKEWNIECVSKFIGMFAIAILDKANHKLYLIRDRVGEKPLYYFYKNNTFIFSSELKGILMHDFVDKEIDRNMLFNYLVYNAVWAPRTIFKRIQQVSPGEILQIDLSQDEVNVKSLQYWKLPDLIPDYSLTEKKVLSDLMVLIYDAVKMRLRSDVPIGVFLSGGIDSSLIAAITSDILPHIKTFTIGYKDKRHNESNYAEFVAKYLKTDHTTICLDAQSAELDFVKLAYITDDCTEDLSVIPQLNLSRETKRYVKVALSGAGGDEFFCGYTGMYPFIARLFKYRYFLRPLTRFLRFNKIVRTLDEVLSGADGMDIFIAQFTARNNLNTIKRIFAESGLFKTYQRVSPQKKLGLSGQKSSFWTLNYYDAGGNFLTDTILKTTDRTSMLHSLEVRSVLTDHRIIEYMARVPEGIILKKGTDKFLLRKLLSRYLPEKFVFDRVKMGFSVPLVTDYYRQWKKSVRNARSIFSGVTPGFFNRLEIGNILAQDTDRYNFRLQSRLVLLAHFMKKWQIN